MNKQINFEEIAKIVLLTLTIISVSYSLFYTFQNFTYPENVNVVLVLPFILFLAPYLILSLYQVKRVESKMLVIPRFLRDVVDNTESGMDLISSIKQTANNEYSVLNEDIRKLSNQLEWGVDFEESLQSFVRNIGSKDLKRDFKLVIEARKVGGHVDKILRELSEKINLENLRKKERESNLASNTFTGYISFIIFIVIIILTYNSLFLQLGETMGAQQGGDVDDSQIKIFLTLITLLAYEISILSGFLFGLMQKGNIIAGAPHVVALVVITFIAFFFFIG